MNEIIKNLIEIDKQARNMVEDAENYRADVLAKLDQEVAEFKEAYVQRAEQRIGLVREEETRVSGRAEMTAREQVNTMEEDLKKVYETNHTQWEESIYKRCIGG